MAATFNVCEMKTANSGAKNEEQFVHLEPELLAEGSKKKLDFGGHRMGPLSERELRLYMEVLGLSSEQLAVPCLDALNTIIAAHLEKIPFQGIDTFVGDNPDLDDDYVFRKLIEQRRGGYCVELNNIFGRLLITLGYRFHIRAARIRWGRPLDTPLTPLGHTLFCVDLGPEGEYFADVGFGGPNPFQALPVEGHLDPYLIRRLDNAGTIEVAIKMTGRGGASPSWRPMYHVFPHPQKWIDFMPQFWYGSRHPRSLFRHVLMVGRFADDAWLTLVDGRFCRRSRSGHVEQRILTSAEDVLRILRDEFIVQINPDMDPERLRKRIQSVL
ncbi:arylamine N-acetyltransferase-like [Haemaphysalis longicornis]